MRPKIYPLLVLMPWIMSGSCLAQSSVEVSPPSLSLKEGKVHIGYRFLRASPSDRFTVRVEITRSNGDLLPAEALSGDIGTGISGAGTKTIVWDPEADSVFLDEEIFVEVFALHENPPAEEAIPAGAGGVTDSRKEENTESAVDKDLPENPVEETSRTLNRTALIVQSIAFPGLGLSRLHPGTPHWIRGVAAYGCLGTSIYLNRRAWNDYQSYQNAGNPQDASDLYDRAYDRKRNSGYLGYAAAAIWAADLVWTIAGTSGMNRERISKAGPGLRMGSTVDPLTGAPLLAFQYRF